MYGETVAVYHCYVVIRSLTFCYTDIPLGSELGLNGRKESEINFVFFLCCVIFVCTDIRGLRHTDTAFNCVYCG